MHNERTSEIAFGNTTSLNPKQAIQKVGPDLDLNDLQRLSAIRQKSSLARKVFIWKNNSIDPDPLTSSETADLDRHWLTPIWNFINGQTDTAKNAGRWVKTQNFLLAYYKSDKRFDDPEQLW